LYCTGLGTVTPAVPDGAGPTGTSQTDNTVQLLIGGQSARVDYAGLAPGFAGLYQINAVVPSGVSSGNVPVAITVAGQTSPPVTIAVK
jgi:adhesin/invasin